MDEGFIDKLYENHRECPKCPSPEVMSNFFQDLLGVLFPDYSKNKFSSRKEFELHLESLKVRLDQILTRNLDIDSMDPDLIVDSFFDQLPYIHERIEEDITAIFEGDPAAKSKHEVIRSYPGFYAIAAYRVARELRKLGVPMIPRIITEHAHSKTGIDIHPGARIGHFFCIDHGTGVVIGETTEIGDRVKIYQGVTLGALSVNKEDAEKKRHPTIGNNVVIYSGATILGGNTHIGDNSIIGGNVWITESVPAGSKIYYRAKIEDGIQTEIKDH